MSIKIYNGIRVPIEKLETFTKWFDKKCLDHIVKKTKAFMIGVIPEIILASAQKAKGIQSKLNMTAEEIVKVSEVAQYFKYLEVAKMYIKAMKQQLPYANPDSWFNAYIYKEYVYVIPGWPTGLIVRRFPKYVEEFGYWDNVDEPEGVSHKNFNKRGVLWKKSGALDSPMKNRLLHNFIYDDAIQCPLILVEREILKGNTICKDFFPASYTAKYRLEEK